MFKECVYFGNKAHFLAPDILESKLAVWHSEDNWVNVRSQTKRKELILLATRGQLDSTESGDSVPVSTAGVQSVHKLRGCINCWCAVSAQIACLYQLLVCSKCTNCVVVSTAGVQSVHKLRACINCCYIRIIKNKVPVSLSTITTAKFTVYA